MGCTPHQRNNQNIPPANVEAQPIEPKAQALIQLNDAKQDSLIWKALM